MPWRISELKDDKIILDFLLNEEWKNIQALSEFISEKKNQNQKKCRSITLIYSDSKMVINGLMVITSTGLIYPVLKSSIACNLIEKENLIRILISLKLKIHGVVGLKVDVDYINNLLIKKIKGSYNYFLLKRDSTKKCEINQQVLVVKASCKDLNKLIHLEYEYQKEEVLLNPNDLNKIATYENFKKKLKESDIYFIQENSFPVSKGGTTNRGINFTLIGGVFTWKEKRNMGYSTNLLKYLINDQLLFGYKSALFVKEENNPAIHLYKKLGFTDPLEYKINYYLN